MAIKDLRVLHIKIWSLCSYNSLKKGEWFQSGAWQQQGISVGFYSSHLNWHRYENTCPGAEYVLSYVFISHLKGEIIRGIYVKDLPPLTYCESADYTFLRSNMCAEHLHVELGRRVSDSFSTP